MPTLYDYLDKALGYIYAQTLETTRTMEVQFMTA